MNFKKILTTSILGLFFLLLFASLALVVYHWKRPLNHKDYYYKDFSGVYIKTCPGILCFQPTYELLDGADQQTFTTLFNKSKETSYAKDKQLVYLRSGIVSQADPATFEIIEDNLAKDKVRVYIGNDILRKTSDRMPDLPIELQHYSPVDGQTFKLLSYSSWYIIFSEASGIYVVSLYREPRIAQHIVMADPPTFRVLSTNLNESRPAMPEAYKPFYDMTAVPAGTVFVHEDPIFIAKDKNFAYVARASGVDIAESFNPSILFTRYGGGYYRVENTVYYLLQPIPIAQLDSFEYLGGGVDWELVYKAYAKDQDYVYYEGKIVEGADPTTFTLLSAEPRFFRQGYAFDGHHRYHQGIVIPESDTYRNKEFDAFFSQMQINSKN